MLGSQFWIGVVEDRNDPEKLGRVRVRILGVHSEKRIEDNNTGEGIPTAKLPWAMPLQPITSAAMNGIGVSPTGLLEGTWVVGITRDGDLYQDLIVLGSVGGVPQSTALNEGFNDPNLVYPKEAFVGEPDTNRLARNEKIEETIVQEKKDGVDKSIPTASGGSWDEPETPYAAEYPLNHVLESESGHIQEVDDTPGAERLHRYHRSGTFDEIHPDGTRVLKVVGKAFTVVLSDDNVHIKGKASVTIDQDVELYIKGKLTQKVDGNVDQTVGGNVSQAVSGNVSQEIGGNVSAEIGGTLDANVSGQTTLTTEHCQVNGPVTTKGDVKLDGGGSPVVCQQHICAFTGGPHPQGSATVQAKP